MGEEVSPDDMLSSVQMLITAEKASADSTVTECVCFAMAEKVGDERMRIDGTLRELPEVQPVNVWFDYPVKDRRYREPGRHPAEAEKPQ